MGLTTETQRHRERRTKKEKIGMRMLFAISVPL